ncbi:hypothetical protein EHE19_016465 [Ruminiclostridium herbifermentans]|uniref:Uncharacterized protein n=1 Tax=Ruminiclostridium herbifermentans TaxID=2488810 RepID=A0A4V6EN16_9FIRM|nr:hypothetical protein [Ruminiclostridium herbifermentans]QNU66438.1 hypothetical protein EHE19_016465 [Ruminiclostridium herbifermentans]
MKRFLKGFSVLVILATLLTTIAYAAVVYESGNNLVTNTERWQYIYDGYGQCQGTSYKNVYIRYSNGASGDTGRLYSQNTYDYTIATVSYTYTDTLNPFAPKVQFNYGFTAK